VVTTLPPPRAADSVAAPSILPSTAGIGHQRALDGLRGIAVLAVLFFHAEMGWMPGGFLGVDVFFVVSGFLITSLLVEEWARGGGIDLRHFWLRRARRLLPALGALLVVVCTVAVLFVPDALVRLRADVVAAVLYVTNWHYIIGGQSYFEALGRPPLLQHLWSLAVEEQWYLIWPLVFVVAMRRFGGAARRLVVPVLVAAALSAIWMAVLYNPNGDVSRVYFGTDTHLSALLIGAAAGLCWAPWGARVRGLRHHVAVDIVGLAALAAVVVLMVSWGSDTALLYRGGFALVALLSVIVVGAAVHPGAWLLAGFLSTRLLVWIGLRSYALYLWHWPVMVVFRQRDLGWSRPATLVFWAALTFALAELSFRFVETPVRRGALGRLRDRLRQAAGSERSMLSTRLQLVAMAAVFLIAGLTVRLVNANAVDVAQGGAVQQLDLGTGTVAGAAAVGASVAATTPGASAASSTPGASAASSTPGASVAAPVAASTPGAAVAGSTPDAAVAGSTPDASAAASVPATTAVLPRRVAVVGDSQATALVKNAPSGLGRYLTLSNGAVEGCGLNDSGTIVTAAAFRRDFGSCKGWQAKWEAAAHQATVTLVTIGAWDVFDVRRNDTVVKFGTPEGDAYLAAQLRSGVAAIEAAGSKVALLEIPCYRNVDGGGLVALPERSQDARTAHLNDLLRAAAAEDPQHVFFVDGPPQWCSDPSIATDLGYRWDGVHYYRPGAKLVFDTVTPALLQIPA
jgi:peptidoglycan/LPS O-acetylase OafA/YrhL